MKRDYRVVARVSKALCDPKRSTILEELRGGEKYACVLQEFMELTQSGLSYHMKVPCESGLVEGRQEGKWTRYQLGRTGREHVVKLPLEPTTPVTRQGTLPEQWGRNAPSQQMARLPVKHQKNLIHNT